jgi:hypothetical protein
MNHQPKGEMMDEGKIEACELCGHLMKDNQHGFDQNDFDIDENENLVYCGHCTYCKECRAELAKTEVGA